MNPPRPRVSVIVATHNRPDALRVTLRALASQTMNAWECFVIGDGCDARTGTVCEELGDARIEYVDLPVRFGEQAGPNAVGHALARGQHLAFLNHDDVWLADHLERALAGIAEADADLYVAPSVMAVDVEPDDQGGVRPTFTALRPDSRRPLDALDRSSALFEPCSAWLVTREHAQRVGPWRKAATLYRTPLADWWLRAVRRGRVVFGEAVTVLYMNTWSRGGRGGSYASACPEFEHVLQWLGGSDVEAIRRELLTEIESRAEPRREPRRDHWWRRGVSRPLREFLYVRLGVDTHTLSCWLKGRGRGALIGRLVRERTATELPSSPPIEEVVRRVQARRRGAR